jgi:hypothetical protein
LVAGNLSKHVDAKDSANDRSNLQYLLQIVTQPIDTSQDDPLNSGGQLQTRRRSSRVVSNERSKIADFENRACQLFEKERVPFRGAHNHIR